MGPISMDLRERVAKAKGSGSSYAVAARFAVSSSWVRKLWGRLCATGSLLPGLRGHRARKVDEEGERLIRAWIEQQPDLTIPEVMARYRGERAVAVSEPAMRRALNRLGLSRKKRRSSQRSARAKKRSPRATTTSRVASDGDTDD
jgi:transposase